MTSSKYLNQQSSSPKLSLILVWCPFLHTSLAEWPLCLLLSSNCTCPIYWDGQKIWLQISAAVRTTVTLPGEFNGGKWFSWPNRHTHGCLACEQGPSWVTLRASRVWSRKSQGILFESGKTDIFGKSWGKLKYFNTADSIPLRAGQNIWRPRDVMVFFLNEERKFVENLWVLMNGWKEQLKVKARSCYFIWHFVFIWSEKFDFYHGKVRKRSGNSKKWGNLEYVLFCILLIPIIWYP